MRDIYEAFGIFNLLSPFRPSGSYLLKLDVHVDSDWAGGADRTSTSGGMVMLEGVGIKHWSRTQRSRAMSSGEA